MFTITDEEIEALIAHYKGQTREPAPPYDLQTLLKYGMMYLYGEKHYRDGRVEPCKSPFRLFETHSCEHEVVNKPKSQIEVKEVIELTRTPACAFHCWAGYNLAMITKSGILHAYFKKDLLFQKSIVSCTAIAASAAKIYLGLDSGGIVYFDPVLQSKTVKYLHSSPVTHLELVDGHLLSSSMDGTVYYKKLIKVSNCGIIASCYTENEKIACACEDNSVVMTDGVIQSRFIGHTSRILDISYRNICVSSAADGQFGFLLENTKMFMRKIGCSRHRFRDDNSLLCYGMGPVKMFDIVKESLTEVSDRASAADVKDNLIAFADSNRIHIRDVRSNDSVIVDVKTPITTLSFSESGSLLLGVGCGSPYMISFSNV